MNNIKIFLRAISVQNHPLQRFLFSNELKDLIQSCDLKVVNFEVPLKPDVTLPPQQYERFWQNDDASGFLQNLGFNLFSIANNHAFDWGNEGLKKQSSLGRCCIWSCHIRGSL